MYIYYEPFCLCYHVDEEINVTDNPVSETHDIGVSATTAEDKQCSNSSNNNLCTPSYVPLDYAVKRGTQVFIYVCIHVLYVCMYIRIRNCVQKFYICTYYLD